MREIPNKNKTILSFGSTSQSIMTQLQVLSVEQLMKLMRIKEPLAIQNQQRFAQFAFDGYGTSAILAYTGLQYQYMNPLSFTAEEQTYASEHLCILSGLYGVLAPYDNIYPYRLEMQSKLKVAGCKDLYTLWKVLISEHLRNREHRYLINLASNEYTKVLDEQWKQDMINISFKVEKEGKLKNEATQAKIARGYMVSYLVKQQATTLAQLKQFSMGGYCFDETLSNEHEYIFIKRNKERI